jgi:hypothetical protein
LDLTLNKYSITLSLHYFIKEEMMMMKMRRMMMREKKDLKLKSFLILEQS